MKHSKLFLIGVLLLLAMNTVAGTRPKGKKVTEKTNHKTVTVTLVRWPYT
jgi:hypothetical protein